jgi:uncharacterized protein YciI
MIMAEDHQNSLSVRLQVRPKHVERLQNLKAEGRLVLAGPNPAIDSPAPGEKGFSGSLIVAEFPSLAEAEKWANADPYVEAGVYKNVIIKPFNKVLP